MSGLSKIICATSAAAVLVLVFFATKPLWKYPHYLAYCKSVGVNLKEAEKHYGKMDDEKEWITALVVEADRGNWDKVEELTAEDRRTEIGTYYRNICMARKGRLGEELMKYYQPFERGLFLPVKEGESRFSISCAGEVWWQLGALVKCEHATMVGMIFSPHQNGERYMRRLAQIQLASGDSEAARKYLNLCKGPVPDDWKDKAALQSPEDRITLSGQDRETLVSLVKANPSNTMAYEYLLCHELLTKDLDAFMADYNPSRIHGRVYDEAVLAYHAIHDSLGPEMAERYDLSDDVIQDFFDYSEIFGSTDKPLEALRPRFGQTYWLYFHFAKRNE